MEFLEGSVSSKGGQQRGSCPRTLVRNGPGALNFFLSLFHQRAGRWREKIVIALSRFESPTARVWFSFALISDNPFKAGSPASSPDSTADVPEIRCGDGDGSTGNIVLGRVHDLYVVCPVDSSP